MKKIIFSLSLFLLFGLAQIIHADTVFVSNGAIESKLIDNQYTFIINGSDTDNLIQYSTSTISSEELKSETIGLYLQPSEGQIDILTKYYSPKEWVYRDYYYAMASGTQPFAFIKTNGTSLTLIDGANFVLSAYSVEKDMIIPDNYPEGNYIISGNLHDILGNPIEVSYNLKVTLPKKVINVRRRLRYEQVPEPIIEPIITATTTETVSEVLNEVPVVNKYIFSKDLKFGSKGDNVIELQKILGVIQTGYFGQITLKSVKEYQQKYLGYSTGYVGIITRTLLNK